MRKWMGVLLLLVAVLVGGCLVYNGKADPVDEDLPEIVVGSDVYPPFYYMNEKGEAAGIDVELAKEAFHRLGLKPKFEIIDWKSRDEILNYNRVDCLWGCFTKDGREDDYQWAGPYMKSTQAVAVPHDSSIQKLSDLKGRLVAVQATTKPEDMFLAHEDSRIPQVDKLMVVDSGDVLFTLLVNGKVDAIAAHREALWQFAQDYGADYRILDEALMEVHLGVAFRKSDNSGIPQKLDKVLKEMKRDGTIQRIAEKYLPDAEMYMDYKEHRVGAAYMEGDGSGSRQ